MSAAAASSPPPGSRDQSADPSPGRDAHRPSRRGNQESRATPPRARGRSPSRPCPLLPLAQVAAGRPAQRRTR
jgi:hypothetical protein